MGAHRARIALSVVVTGLAVLGCLPEPPPAIPASQMTGPLRDATSEEARLELERREAADTTLQEWIADYGPPDYLATPSDHDLVLFYVARDLEAHFRRGWLASSSGPPRTDSVRAHHHRFFSNDDRERLGQLRRERAVEDERTRRARARETSREVPAARDD